MKRNSYRTIEDFEIQNSALALQLPQTTDVSILKQPLELSGKTVHNRLLCQAMEGCDGTWEGKPSELTRRRYLRLARGGAGVIWFEATAVLKDGRANPRQLYISEENLDAFKALVAEIKEAGRKANGYAPLLIMQATHSGRYSKPQGTPAPLIAYHNPILEKNNPIDDSRILSDADIDRIQEALIQGACLAQEAGFDGVDIKCCHRYLNSELLSAYTREGKYGGSFMNRTRLLRESVAGAVQSCSSDFLVSTRLNIYDGMPYPFGFGVSTDGSTTPNLEEPKQLVKLLYDSGMRLLNTSMGNPYFTPHINRPFAKGGYEPTEHPLEGVARILNGAREIKEAVPQMAVISSGLSFLGVAAPHVTAACIQNGWFDFAGFGRTAFAYPDFANDILKNGDMQKEKMCICCSKCTELMRAGSETGCVVRDTVEYLPRYKQKCQG